MFSTAWLWRLSGSRRNEAGGAWAGAIGRAVRVARFSATGWERAAPSTPQRANVFNGLALAPIRQPPQRGGRRGGRRDRSGGEGGAVLGHGLGARGAINAPTSQCFQRPGFGAYPAAAATRRAARGPARSVGR